MLPLAIDELSDGFTETVGVFANEDIGADGDGLLMLCVVVKSDTGDAVESGLFGDVARVGDDTLGVSCQPAELKVG